MSFLGLSGQTILVMGLSSRRSVAWHIGRILEAEGARVLYGVHREERLRELGKLLDGRPAVLCDVEQEAEIAALPERVRRLAPNLDGLVHSIAYANYSGGSASFDQAARNDFLQSVQVSAFSVVEMVRALDGLLSAEAAVVAISISSLEVTAPTYGYLSPVKAALEGCMRNLAKAYSGRTRRRFNCVAAGPIKTRASAGIPHFLENFLHAEQLTMRKQNLSTDEVANAAVFLLSPRSSGINGQRLVVNAGMDLNYFDEGIVGKTTRADPSAGGLSAPQ